MPARPWRSQRRCSLHRYRPLAIDKSDDLLLIPLLDALVRSARSATVEVLSPPYDAAGIGTLRVVRASERDDRLELTAAYEGYARL